MAEKTNVPEIRFAGFTDPWEQRKLSELTTMHARIGWQNLRTYEFLDSGNYYLITGTDFENGYVNLSTCHYVNKDRYDQDPNIQIDNGSILITKDGTLGKVALVQGLDKPATLNAGVFNVVIRNEKIVDNGYLYQYLKAPFLLNYVAQTATGGTIKHLNQNILIDFPVSMPSKGEQELIGDAFLRLDNLITLHQRKYDKLCAVKKSMLDKMFPKPGEVEPEIRFAGFTDPWEQRKLGDVATIVGGGTPSTNNDAYWDGDIDWYSPAELGEQVYADRSVRRITQAGYDSCSATLLPAGKTILFTSRAGIGNTAILRRSACTNQGFQSLVMNDDIDVYFIYSMTDRIKKFAEQKASGSTFLEISGKGLAAGEFTFPSKDEQTAIGSMFKQLDYLITLHQRELNLLKNTKKSLLDKMFV